jgi:hypothetical protein
MLEQVVQRAPEESITAEKQEVSLDGVNLKAYHKLQGDCVKIVYERQNLILFEFVSLTVQKVRQAPGRTGLSNQELDIDIFKAFFFSWPGARLQQQYHYNDCGTIRLTRTREEF